MTPASTDRSAAAIDGLRGLAALGVALFHVRVTLWVGWRELQANPERYSAFDRALAWLAAPMPFLGSMVMLFFVISGFCVHVAQAGRDEPLGLGRYFRRRVGRIYPPYLVVALVCGVAAVAGAGSLGLPATDWALVGRTLAMVQNYSAEGSGGQLPTNPALWSLPVEMELYLAYPLLLWAARRFGWGAASAGVLVLTLAATWLRAGGIGWLTGNFAFYWAVWSAGAWLAERWRGGTLRPPPAWCGGLAIVFLAAALRATHTGRGAGWEHLGYGAFYAWAVWLLLARPEWWARLPAGVARALGGLGRISYSLYLVHFPLFVALGAAWLAIAGAKPASLLVPLAATALAVPVAAWFYRWVEAPSHRWARGKS